MKKSLQAAVLVLMVGWFASPVSAGPAICIPRTDQGLPECSNSIWGYVVDYRSLPLEGAVVSEGDHSVTTDAEGYFELVDATYPLRNSFQVSASWSKGGNTCLEEKEITSTTGIRPSGNNVSFELGCFAPKSLTIVAEPDEAFIGDDVEVSVSLFDAFGDHVEYPNVWFQAGGTGGENPAYGNGYINETTSVFTFTSAFAGNSIVYASSYGLWGGVSVRWWPLPQPAHIELTPVDGESGVGVPYTLTAYATDSAEQHVNDGTWISFHIDGPDGGIDSGYNVVGIANGPGGYWTTTEEGGIFNFGDVEFYGEMAGFPLPAPIVGMAAPPGGEGYWLVASNGGVFAFGEAGFFGSMGGVQLEKPVVGMAATPSGNGYWLVASDGGVFGFGDAGFYGSTGGIQLNKPVVGMAATPSGNGYWLVASDGGVFSFGNASFFGSTGGMQLNKEIVGMAATANGGGYWLVASDGGIFTFGTGGFYGSTGGQSLTAPIVSMFAREAGYTLAGGDGEIWTFGDNSFVGSLYASQTENGFATFTFDSTAIGTSEIQATIRNTASLVTAVATVTWVAM